MGFDYFYGFVGGDASQWEPNLFRNTTAIYPFQGNPGWNLTTAMADEAIQYIKQLKELAPEKPFLVYYVPGGVHAPHHPTKDWIDKISAMHLFDDGWEKLRETIFANQKKLGIMPENAQLTPWPDGQEAYGGAKLPKWDSLDWEQKKLFIKQVEVYAAYQAYTGHEIGRVIQAVEDLGQLDNTLIIYISGDNGASAEGMLNGTPNEFTTFNGIEVPVKDQFLWYEFWGSDRTYPHFAAPWAWAMDTPFKWMKQVPSHFGGTAQGLAMSWPGHIKDVGGIRRQFHHVIDIVPTILEATGIPAPATVNGIKQRPIEGVSMVYTWDKANANARTRHRTQYFEMLGNRAIYHDGWVACTTPVTLPWELSTKPPPDVITGYKWELYNVMEDPTENNDLAAKMPAKVKQMQNLFYIEAKKYNVLPPLFQVGPAVSRWLSSGVSWPDFRFPKTSRFTPRKKLRSGGKPRIMSLPEPCAKGTSYMSEIKHGRAALLGSGRERLQGASLAQRGTARTDNLFQIIKHLQAREGIRLEVAPCGLAGLAAFLSCLFRKSLFSCYLYYSDHPNFRPCCTG
jgi:arylsulfatase A-like enzyme